MQWKVRELEQFMLTLKWCSNEWEGKNKKQERKKKKKKKPIDMGITNSFLLQFDFMYFVFW